MLSLPPKLVDMRVPIFFKIADRDLEFSKILSNYVTSKKIVQERQHKLNDNSMVIKSKKQNRIASSKKLKKDMRRYY